MKTISISSVPAISADTRAPRRPSVAERERRRNNRKAARERAEAERERVEIRRELRAAGLL
jgi:hypothetical protein